MITGMAAKNANGPDTNANTATVGRYVKTKRVIVTAIVNKLAERIAGRTGLMSVGWVTK
jgi:hypothetical protein